MQIGILGPLLVTFKSTPVRVAGLRQRRILAALALHPNAPVSIDRLIDVLWDEAPPKTAREQVQNCTGQLAGYLRTVSGKDLIVRQPGCYALKASEGNLDVLHLSETIQRSDEFSEAGRTAEAQQARRAALDLWRGDVLADVLTDGMRARATQLEEIRTTTIERYVDIAVQNGDYDAAITELSTAVARQPFNERLCELLMRAFQKTGRPADALAVYAQMRDRLARELNLQPGTALAALQQKIMLDSSPATQLQSRSRRHPPAAGSLRGTRQSADLEAVRLLQKATGLLSTALGLLESSMTRPNGCRRYPECRDVA